MNLGASRCGIWQLSPVLFVLLVLLPSGLACAQSQAGLQALVNDTVAQLKLAYRDNVPEGRSRYDALAEALAAWRQAPRNDANNRLLENWLRGAIRSSMPGSQQLLPPLPQFEHPPTIPQTEQPENVEPAPAAVAIPPTTTPHMELEAAPAIEARSPTEIDQEQALGDPFGDDPFPAE